MLLHLVIKVSRLLQPSVIYIDQAEKTFLKKGRYTFIIHLTHKGYHAILLSTILVSKTDKSDPKRLKKDLPRLVRSLAAEDRVILIGSSRCPWECEQKVLHVSVWKWIHYPWNHLLSSGTDPDLPKDVGAANARLRPPLRPVEEPDCDGWRPDPQVVRQIRLVFTDQGVGRLHCGTHQTRCRADSHR